MHAPAARSGDRLQVVLVPHDDVGAAASASASSAALSAPITSIAHVAQPAVAQLARLLRVGDRQPARAAGERGARALHSAPWP